jgi:hypothetical protein
MKGRGAFQLARASISSVAAARRGPLRVWATPDWELFGWWRAPFVAGTGHFSANKTC